jgi:hypothetical protein
MILCTEVEYQPSGSSGLNALSSAYFKKNFFLFPGAAKSLI